MAGGTIVPTEQALIRCPLSHTLDSATGKKMSDGQNRQPGQAIWLESAPVVRLTCSPSTYGALLPLGSPGERPIRSKMQ